MMGSGTQMTTGDEAHTQAVAADLASQVSAGAVVAMYGPMGAGKTQFVRGLVAALGGDASQVSSPTFVLMHEYDLGSGGGDDHDGGRSDGSGGLIRTLVHIDAYRIGGADEFADMGIELGEADADGGGVLTCIEWADRVLDALLPCERMWQVWMDHDPAGRSITIQPPVRQ